MSSSTLSDFLTWIVVSHENNQPAGTVTELHGGNADINAGFGGSNIWLRRLPATEADKLVDNLWIAIGHGDGARSDDLAKGAGGDYRFMDVTHNMTATKFLTDIALWRQSIPQGAPPHGWDGMTNDINQGRGGDNLYIVWKHKEYTGPR